MTVHKDYDGRSIRASHIGENITATVHWAGWDDWYYIHVTGTFDNGNKVDNAYYCREQAHTVEQYLLPMVQP